MLPRLVDFGAFEIFGREFHPVLHTYGLLLGGGFLVGLWVAARRARRLGIDPQRIYELGLYLVLGALVGAKVLYVVVNPEALFRNPMGVLTAGGVFFGGFLGAAAAAIWFFRSRRIPVWEGGDLLAPSIALGHCVGRMGCFAAGCCYGVPSDGPAAVTFTDVYANEVTGVPLHTALHPTQLYEAGLEFGLFLFLIWLARRRAFPGQIFVTWLGIYATGRFLIEFWRGDPRGFVLDGLLSTSQFLGLWLVAAALLGFFLLRRRAA